MWARRCKAASQPALQYKAFAARSLFVHLVFSFSFHASISFQIAKNKGARACWHLGPQSIQKEPKQLREERSGYVPVLGMLMLVTFVSNVSTRSFSLFFNPLLAIFTILLLNHAKGPDSQCSPVYFCLFMHVCVCMSRNHACQNHHGTVLSSNSSKSQMASSAKSWQSDTLAQNPQNSTKLRHLPRPCVQTNQFSWLFIHS